MKKQGYNGWSNYETWVVKLWMDNEEGSYNYWRDATEEERERAVEDSGYYLNARQAWRYRLADRLKDEHEEASYDWREHGEGQRAACVFDDLLNVSLQDVNWSEIAESLIEGWVESRQYAKKQERAS